MRNHLKTLLWLKFTLFRHILTKSTGARVTLALTILVYLLVVGAALGISAALFFLARSVSYGAVIKEGGSLILFAVSNGFLAMFLLFWFIGLMTEIQRSDIIDFRKMLYFPVSLRMVLGLNFFVSLFSPALIFYALPVGALILGLATNGFRVALIGIPLAAAYYLMLAAWTYFIRGFLAALMENKRRRRTVLAVVAIIAGLIGWVPNMVFNPYFHQRRDFMRTHSEEIRKTASRKDAQSQEEMKALTQKRDQQFREDMNRLASTVTVLDRVVPLGWLAYGIHSLVNRKPFNAVLCSLGSFSLGILGLALSYRSTWRFYVGAQRVKRIEPEARRVAIARKQHRPLIAVHVPFMDDETVAVASAGFRTYIREPSIRMLAVMPVLVAVALISMRVRSGLTSLPAMYLNVGLAGALFLPMFGVGIYMLNIFGVDRSGFRTFVLLPTARRKYLVGKNLALFPVVGSLSLFFTIFATLIIRPAPSRLFIALMQIIQVYVLFCIAGNFVSSLLPYRISQDAMKSSRNQWRAALSAFVAVFLTPVLLVPASLCVVFGTVTISAIVLAATFALYFGTLPAAGNVLREREESILQALLRENE